MVYKSIFDYLKEDNRFKDVYDTCMDMEIMALMERPKISLYLARRAAELLIQLVIDQYPDLKNKLNEKAKKEKKNHPSLYDMIEGTHDEGIILDNIYHRYDKIRYIGNKYVHGNSLDNFGMDNSKLIHGYLFHVALECYNRYHKDNKIHIPYEYQLDKSDYAVEFTSRTKDFTLKSIKAEEVEKLALEKRLESKSIFIPISSFNEVIKEYEEKIKDREKYEKYMEGISYVDDENIDGILKSFYGSSHNKIKKALKETHERLSQKFMETLIELNQKELSFSGLNELIKASTGSEEKVIYEHIKALADDIAKSELEEYMNELKNSPVSKVNEFGRKVNRYLNYELVEDDFGFSIREVDENIFLDEDQKEAVEYTGEKPLVVNAGPGSGKTRVIIERVVYLVKELKKDPSSILVITFTRKATQELRERLINETDLDMNDINHIRISTVHSFCRYILSKYDPMPYNYLRRHGERNLFLKKYKKDLGFVRYAFLQDPWISTILEKYDEYFNFKVDTEGLVKSIETKMGKRYQRKMNELYREYIDDFYSAHDINEYPDYYESSFRRYKSSCDNYIHLNLAKSYPKFREIMEMAKTCDDNTILEKTNEILENENILNNLRFKNILIDEFQDTDRYQKLIFDKLLTICETFTIVGDVDQSIFGWRGAFPEYFEEFRERDVKEVILHTNYRSTRDIVEFNEELIKDKRSFEKNMVSKKKYKAPIFHMSNNNEIEEADRIVNLIRTLKKDKKIKYYSDVAVLFRRNSSVEKLIKPLDYWEIPYILKDNKDYIQQNEVRAILTLFWYLMPYDKYELNHLGDDFLNLYGFTDVKYKSSDIFHLSPETMNVLAKLQKDFEDKLIKQANDYYLEYTHNYPNFNLRNVFNISKSMKKEIFEGIETFDIAELDKKGLVDLGIRNENDLDFFLNLKNLKSKIWDGEKFAGRITTLKLFYTLLNLTDYFNQISLDSNATNVKIKQNFALFSHIIKDYESIMGETDYLGLFNYLSRVLKAYACPFNDEDEGFDKVHLYSMHSAKGLQYPVVIVGSLKQGSGPLNFKYKDNYYNTPRKYLEYKETDNEKARKKHDDEEIRTIYVATTRAKEVLILSTLKDSKSDIPGFLEKIKLNPNIKIENLEPYNVSRIPKIESSKIYKINDIFPHVNFEDIINDYLYCSYRYDIANNTRFKVKLKNDKYIDMVLHNLLENIHSKVNISNEKEIDYVGFFSEEDIDRKINTIINYHNLNYNQEVLKIIKNVKDYWNEYGKNYKIVNNDIKILTQMKYCDLHSKIDLIIEEDDGELSVVKFIGTDTNIPDLEIYKFYLVFYVHVLKELDEYKDKKFKNIYLHSLYNNKRHDPIPFDQELCEFIKEDIQKYTLSIHDNKYAKNIDNCENCEYFGNVCRG